MVWASRTRCYSPHFLLDQPFTSKNLSSIRVALSAESCRAAFPPDEPQAAVLVPLCNIEGRPSLLYEVRGKLRSHAGEVSFPGGRVDGADESDVAAALRETHEELGIHPGRVEVLGQLAQPVLSLGGLRVFPFVGFVHSSQHWRNPTNPGESLASINVRELVRSPVEVVHIFHKPITSLLDKGRMREDEFRGGTPYYAIDVTDEVEGLDVELGDKERKGLEIWGLTGWYTNILLQRLGLLE